MRLVQLAGASGARRVAMVDGGRLRLLGGCDSVYSLAQAALASGISLTRIVGESVSAEAVEYDAVYRAESTEWRLLPPFTHPEPARLMVSGTGLTHTGSAKTRQAMHAKAEELSDSIRMYLDGVKGGKAAPGEIGVAPEWFYKGCGGTLRAHGDALEIPNFACDGGEEAEIAGVYLIDEEGAPRRIGMAIGNEFSDHVLEKRNYLYLAHSKLRMCALGPELVVDADFSDVRGTVSIERAGAAVWSKQIASGEANMSHSLTNLEHYHFQYEAHRRPGDGHVHFFGADALSFGDGLRLEDGDVMAVAYEGFGRALRNVVRRDGSARRLVEVVPV